MQWLSLLFYDQQTNYLNKFTYIFNIYMLSSLLQVNVYVTHNLLNILVRIANKMGFKTNICNHT
jgi:hypothetical protein